MTKIKKLPESEQFYIGLQGQIDDIQDLLKVCIFMMWFIHKKKLWGQFSTYAKKQMKEWKDK